MSLQGVPTLGSRTAKEENRFLSNQSQRNEHKEEEKNTTVRRNDRTKYTETNID